MTATRGHGASLASGGRPTVRRVRAYIGLGANLGDAAGDARRAAIRALAALPGVRLHAVSRLYVTRPVGVVDQPAVPQRRRRPRRAGRPGSGHGRDRAAVALKQLERAFGRQERERWGPRELDLDLLDLRPRPALARSAARGPLARSGQGGPRCSSCPTREAAERLFVLAPLADVAAGLVPPGWRETVATAAARRRRARARTRSARSPRGTGPRGLDAGRPRGLTDGLQAPRNRVGRARLDRAPGAVGLDPPGARGRVAR